MATATDNNNDLFEDRLVGDSIVWAGKCVVLTAAMAIGIVADKLRATCIAVILAFAFWQGLRPYGQFVRDMRAERRQCREEFEEIFLLDPMQGRQFIEELLEMDCSESGAVVRLCQAIVVGRSRGVSAATTIDAFVELEEKRWQEKLSSTNAAVEQVVQCGLLGSLIGITASLAAGTDIDQIAAGMSTMTSTTVVGISTSLLLWGFAELGNRAIERHLAELAEIGGMLSGDGGTSPTDTDGLGGNDGGQFTSLFAGRRHATQTMEA